MKLYDFTPAPSPRRVRIFLAEKNVKTENIQVNLLEGEQFSAEHRKRNPTLDIPVLELDDGSCIHQVDAICRYIEETVPANPLYGRDPLERAHTTAWNHRLEMQGLMAVAEAYRNSTPHFVNRALTGPRDYPQSKELAERGRMRIPHFMDDLNNHLEGHQYLVGDYFSVADITAMVTIDFARWVKFKIPETHQHLQRWYDEVSVRPSSAA